MYHHHITHAIAERRAAHTQRTAARHRPTPAVPPRHRRPIKVAALIALCALGPTPSALAQPAHHIGTSTSDHATPIARDHHPRAAPRAITFSNPLGRSRGPGAGGGLL